MDWKLTTSTDADNPVEGDLHLGPNKALVLIEGNDKVAQHLKAHLQSFKGEWFLDENHGVPWFQDIFGKGRSLPQVNQIIKRHVLSVPGVREILSWRTALGANRTLSINARVRFANGAVEPVDLSVP